MSPSKTKNQQLLQATSDYNLAMVETLLKDGADPNYEASTDNLMDQSSLQPTSPLKMVVFRISDSFLGDEELKIFAKIAQLLIDFGANPAPAMELATSRYGEYKPQSEENPFMEVWAVIAKAMPI